MGVRETHPSVASRMQKLNPQLFGDVGQGSNDGACRPGLIFLFFLRKFVVHVFAGMDIMGVAILVVFSTP